MHNDYVCEFFSSVLSFTGINQIQTRTEYENLLIYLKETKYLENLA